MESNAKALSIRKTNHRYRILRSATSTSNNNIKSTGKPSSGGTDEIDEDDDEGWVPPVRAIQSAGGSDDSSGDGESPSPQSSVSSTTISSKTTTTFPKSKRIETFLEASRQVKEQERLDRILEETEQEAEALFQLSEEEQAAMTDEEILERLEEVLKKEEELEEEIFRQELERETEEQQRSAEMLASKESNNTKGDPFEQQFVATDWMRNRRAALGGNDGEDKEGTPSSMSVPVLRHTLLTRDEIQTLLEAHGGVDIVVVEDDPEAPRMGGADGMVFCSCDGWGKKEASNNNSPEKSSSGYLQNKPYLISTLSRVLIDHMRDRGLHEIGIAPGAQQNTMNRAATSSLSSLMHVGSSNNNPSESWRVVDCGNYIVHILDEATRMDLRLEDLWSGSDPLWKLNVFDEDEVEDYCARHPVPESYNGTGSSSSNGLLGGGDDDSLFDGAAIKRLQKNQFGSTRRHKPVISQAIKNRDRKAERRKRRAQREQNYAGS